MTAPARGRLVGVVGVHRATGPMDLRGTARTDLDE
ncbi:MAG: hypothetical protein JJLCMIEE_02269 [Acidimicrobiales bacterium]|nr:hypothetical protein [Acidimicrobiales bacterium]